MAIYECCKGCEKPKRYPGCQGPKCKDWVEANKLVEAEKEIIRKNKDLYYSGLKFAGESVERHRKRRRLKSDKRRSEKSNI